MFCKVTIKQNNIFRIIFLMNIIVLNSIKAKSFMKELDENAVSHFNDSTNNTTTVSYDDSFNSKDTVSCKNNDTSNNNSLSYNDDSNRKCISSKNIPSLNVNNISRRSNIDYQICNTAKEIIYNIHRCNHTNNEDTIEKIPISYIQDILWNSYANNNRQPYNEKIQKLITYVNEKSNILLKRRKFLKSKKNVHIEKRNNKIEQINKISNTDCKELAQNNFEQQENLKLTKYLNKITELNEGHKEINSKKAIIDTYFKIQLILSNSINNTFEISSIEEDIQYNLHLFSKGISENIKSFYESCLIGNHVYKLPEEIIIYDIQSTVSKLERKNVTQKDIKEKLTNVTKKISELEMNSNLKCVKNNLKALNSEIFTIKKDVNVKNVIDKLMPLNKEIKELKNNIYNILTKHHSHNSHEQKHNIKKTKQEEIHMKLIQGIKQIIPTTDNIMSWCEENYEDWDAKLSKYEETIVNLFKYKLNSSQMTKQYFNNTVVLLNHVSLINTKIENYYYTAKLLYNLWWYQEPKPIIIPIHQIQKSANDSSNNTTK